jgi:ribonuclease HI
LKNEIIFYTDASFKNGFCRYAFKYHMPQMEAVTTFIYGNCDASSSLEAELIAVTKALEYIIQYLGNLGDARFYINVDEGSIVDFITRKVYIRWNLYGWKVGEGKFRRKHIELWHKLMCLYQSFPKKRVFFTKVKSKVNRGNKIVHSIANFVTSHTPLPNLEGYIICDSTLKSLLDSSAIPSTICIDEYKIKEDEKPWNNSNVLMSEGEKNRGNFHWLYSTNDKVENLPIADILITEREHLQCKKIDFNGMLERVNKANEVSVPIAVRKIEGTDKYSLVMGVTRLFSAKILGIEYIPAIVTDLKHEEFKLQHSIG